MLRNNDIFEIKNKDLHSITTLFEHNFKGKMNEKSLQIVYNNLKKNSSIKMYAYYIDDKPIGVVTVHVHNLKFGNIVSVWDLCVDKDYRRMQIGTKLLKKAENIAKFEYNAKSIWIFNSIFSRSAYMLCVNNGYNMHKEKAFVKII